MLLSQVQNLLVENRLMEVNNDFSQFIECAATEIPQPILDDICRIGNLSAITLDRAYYKHGENIVVRVTIELSLPTRYDVEQGLVNRIEPAFIEFSKDYPDTVPHAYIGRLDFDVKHAPHIYCDKDGLRGICLFRGNGNEWYADMEIEDYIKQLRSWYEDLASESNLTDGCEYEPLRLEGYSGNLIYDYERLSKLIDRLNTTPTYWYLMGFVKCGQDYVWNLEDKDQHPVMCGAICWNKEHEFNDYDVNLPKTFGALKSYAEKYQVDFSEPCNVISSFNVRNFIIILAIRRSRKLIGVNSNYQFVNFMVHCDTKEDGSYILSDSSQVSFYAQSSPFTQTKAREISGLDTTISPSLIFAGCGALGSKIATHFIRSGMTNILFMDPDRMNVHNLARHALYADSVGVNKALAMKKIADECYKCEKSQTISLQYPLQNLFDIFSDNQDYKNDYIIDFTASKVVYNQLVHCSNRPNVISGAIYDSGSFALLMCEDKEMKYRLDDIFVSFMAQYKEDRFISKYLMDDKRRGTDPMTHLHVGLGCNSETFVLSDDIISLYAAGMSISLKQIFKSGCSDGICLMYTLDPSGGVSVRQIKLPDFRYYDSDGWSIRMDFRVIEELQDQARKYCAYETGGYLIGNCNLKNKTIHVVDCLEAPVDSEHSPDSFVLGKEGYQKIEAGIRRKSGCNFGYIGEWHSHPNGPEEFSETDIVEFENKITELRRTHNNKPILEVLLTPSGVRLKVLSILKSE